MGCSPGVSRRYSPAVLIVKGGCGLDGSMCVFFSDPLLVKPEIRVAILPGWASSVRCFLLKPETDVAVLLGCSCVCPMLAVEAGERRHILAGQPLFVV